MKSVLNQHSNSGDNEWMTPINIIESARAVLGQIDVDPASNEEAQQVILAKRYYTAERSALPDEVEWRGTVFMNPPYSRSLIRKFITKLTEQWMDGITKEAIVVVNAGTETKWFQRLGFFASSICFTNHRLAFLKDGKPLKGNTKGQAIFYIGSNPELFELEFQQYGLIVWPIADHQRGAP